MVMVGVSKTILINSASMVSVLENIQDMPPPPTKEIIMTTLAKMNSIDSYTNSIHQTILFYCIGIE